MRFFFLTDEPPSLEGKWTPPKSLDKHLAALRINAETDILLILPKGGAIRARRAKTGDLELFGLAPMPKSNLMPITLATAWPKGARADDLIVRATEAGVKRIIPLICERSVAGQKPFSSTKITRFRKLARETCQQSGRPNLPTIDRNPIQLDIVLEEAPQARPVALTPGAWPLNMELGLHSPQEILLLVGPEGGFSHQELALLESLNVSRAGLLPTILRIESAGPFAAGLCQHWSSSLREQ
ncbi:MAG TPA: hypothetical protein DDW23_01395 [Planctomycetes bacterium]|nr:hypothetical protein [Planctomycetota bacterium]